MINTERERLIRTSRIFINGEFFTLDDVSIRQILSDGSLGPNLADEFEIDPAMTMAWIKEDLDKVSHQE